MEEQAIGVTTCPTCNKRFRVFKKHESFIGKSIQCPKCKRPFVVHIETPSPLEQAAMATADAAAKPTDQTPTAATPAANEQEEKARIRRRTQQQIKKELHRKIKDEFRPFMRRLRAIATIETSSEEEVRRWCIDVLRTALGYEDGDIDTETSALGQRIDIAIKHEGKVILVIECKNVRMKLGGSTRDQAVVYAVNKSANWAAVTNGQDWSLYRVIPVKGHDPRVVEVFSISLLDDDGLSNYDIERLYLLTKRALLRGETEKEFHLAECLDDQRLLKAMASDRVIQSARKALIKSYRQEFGEIVRLTNDDVRERLVELTKPSDL